MRLQETTVGTTIGTLRLAGYVGRQEMLLGLAGKPILLVVHHAIVASELYIAMTDERMATISEPTANAVAVVILRIEVIDSMQSESLTVRVSPLSIVEDDHQQERLDVNVVEAQHLMAQRQVGIGLDQLLHPYLVVLEHGGAAS